jgi:hypothetical protein
MILNKKKMETNVKEFHQSEFELEIDYIIDQLTDKDCQKVEFLRGMLATYRKLIENKQGWKKKQLNDYFK